MASEPPDLGWLKELQLLRRTLPETDPRDFDHSAPPVSEELDPDHYWTLIGVSSDDL